MLSYISRRNPVQKFNRYLSDFSQLTLDTAQNVKSTAQVLEGHAWTVVPYGVSTITTPPVFGGTAFETTTNDPKRGPVPVHGTMYHAHQDRRPLVILLHGIASTPQEPYMRRMARNLVGNGLNVLSLALRGAQGLGSDHYHAGLTDDLVSVFSDPRVATFDEVFIVGFSLGGQIALRYALSEFTEQLKGVISLCSPISMLHSQRVLDGPTMLPYRLTILSSLKRKYRRLAKNGIREGNPVLADTSAVQKVRTFYEWDQTVVCPRYGYESVEAYYADVSVAPHLCDLPCPTLMVFTANDPLIPIHQLKPYLKSVNQHTDVHILTQGGHLGFSGKADLRHPGRKGVQNQVSAWIEQKTGSRI